MRLTWILLIVACTASAICSNVVASEPAPARLCPVPLDARLIFNETMDALARAGVTEDCKLQYVNVTSKLLTIGLHDGSPSSVDRIKTAMRHSTEVVTRLTRSRQPRVETVANGNVEIRYQFKPNDLWTCPVEVASPYEPIAERLIESCDQAAKADAKILPLALEKGKHWTDAKREVTLGEVPLENLWILLHNFAAVELGTVTDVSVTFDSMSLRKMVDARIDKRKVKAGAVVALQTSYVPTAQPK